MEPVNYFLGLVIIFAGLIVGMILGFIAKEELKPGKKYLSLLQKFILAAVFIIAIIYSPHIALKTVLAGILVYLFIFKFSFNDIFTYGIFGFLFYVFINNLNLTLLLSSLMFLHGLPIGSLMTEEMKKQDYRSILKSIIYRYVWIIIVGMALFVVI
jgi:hypothetical protein